MPSRESLSKTEWLPLLDPIFVDHPYKEAEDPRQAAQALMLPKARKVVKLLFRFKEAADPLAGIDWKVGDFLMDTKQEQDQRLLLIDKLKGGDTERQYMLFPDLEEMLVNVHREPPFPVGDAADLESGLRILASQ